MYIKLLRDLSFKSLYRGSVLLSKVGLSRLTYVASSIHLDNKTIDQILFNFQWKNRMHYIRKSVVVNSLKSGGLDFLDFSNSFKMNWLKFCFKKPVYTYFYFGST